MERARRPVGARASEALLDLNRILLFIALLSPLVVLARTWRRAALNRTWRLAALAVLIVVVVAWIVVPRSAGFVGGGAWLLLLFLPAAGLHKAAELASEQRFARSRRMVTLLAFLHPAPLVLQERELFRALELAQLGRTEMALQLLHALASQDTRVGRQAIAHRFRILREWEALANWYGAILPRLAGGSDPVLLPLYFRALGEAGRIDHLVAELAARAPAMLGSPAHQAAFDESLLLTLAFAGRTASVKLLLHTRLRRWRRDTKEFWLATSELAAAKAASGRTRLARLADGTHDALVRGDIASRLKGTEAVATPLSPTAEATISRFERGINAPRGSLLAPPTSGVTPAVATLIALNVAMFLIETFRGGSTNFLTLHRLGALEPLAVLGAGQYWRLFTALFLHYGALHLMFNAYALYVLGPSLELSIGSFRFAAAYLIAGLGSSAGVVALWRLGWTQADFVVGASGCVLGIVGVWAGLLLRQRHAPLARRRLANIAIIVAIQTAFDLYTPQISMAAHLCGLATGLIVGLLLRGKATAL